MPTDSSSSAKNGSQPAAARQQPQLSQPPFRYAPPQQQLPYPIGGTVPIIPRQPPPPANAQPGPPYYPPPPFQTPPMSAYPGPVQQPYPLNGYVYQPTQYPYHMPNAPPQPMLNTRPQPSFRTSAPPPQPVQKSILKIVDPDTNEEVKIDQQAAPAPQPPSEPNRPPVKIPPRRSRALELVPDPADAPERSPASENKAADTEHHSQPEVSPIDAPVPESHHDSEKDAMPSEPQAPLQAQTDAQPELVTETSNDSSNMAPVTTPAQSQPTPTETRIDDNKEKTQPSTPIDVTPVMKPSTPAEIELMTSDVSSTTLIDAQQEEKDLPLPPVEPPSVSLLPESDTKAPAEEPASQPPVVPDEAPAAEEPSPSTEEPSEVKSEAEPESATSPPEAKQEPEKEPTPEEPSSTPDEGDADATEEAAVNEDTSPEDSASRSSSPPRRARSSFLSDGRLIYPPSFMWAVRPNIPARKTAEYDASLRSGGREIFKGESSGGRSDSRSQSGRNRAPLSSDPRGSRTYPTPGSAPFSMPVGGPHGSGPGGRNFPDFDLSLARSQPPPPPRGQSSVREGDPRGSRQQQSRGRYDQTRHAHSDPFIHRAPVEKLKRTEHGWKRNKDADDEITTKVKTVRSLLNKLTLEKFDKIFKQIVDIDINSHGLLDSIVKEIFEKTLFEPEFSGMYAELCRRLDTVLSEPLKRANVTDNEGKPIPFKRILVNNCRDEFTRFAESAESKDDDKKEDESGDGKSEEEKTKKEPSAHEKEEADLRATNAKRRMLANVRFIGELYLKDLLREGVIHRYCIQRLLKLGIESKEEDVLEALCKLVSKTGAKISTNPEAEKLVREYFSRFESLGRDHTLPARIRFMIQDLIEQRRNGWKVRRQKKGAKTIAEIHKEAKEEERKKMEAQQAARDRRHRGGGMGSRDRMPQGFVPRMTMPSGPRQGSNQSRLDRTLEKQPNRPISGISGGFPPVSLRPGTSSARVGSLRPGGSSFGSFGVLSDKDTSANGQATETRRSKMGSWQPVSRRSQSHAPKSAPPKPDLMDPKVLKRKAKGTMEEYWANPSLAEVREILAEEIKAPNYKSFIQEALVATFSAKVAHQMQSIDLFAGLIDAPIPGQMFCECYSKLVGTLSDMEIDNPRTGEFLGRIMGATAATKKLNLSDAKLYGLGFLAKDIQALEDPKRRANLAIFTFAELYQRLNASVPDDEERANVVRQVADRIHVDLAADMSMWNPMRGLDKLSDMLSSKKVSFLVPYLETENRLKQLINEKESCEKVEKLLRSASEVANSSLMRMVVRVGFDSYFMSATDDVVELFKKYIGAPVVSGFGSLSLEVQFSVLLATQVYIGRSLTLLPPLSNANEKHGDIAFKALLESGLVENHAFTRWLQDKSESEKVSCKKEMIEQTQRFFKLLPKAK